MITTTRALRPAANKGAEMDTTMTSKAILMGTTTNSNNNNSHNSNNRTMAMAITMDLGAISR